LIDLDQSDKAKEDIYLWEVLYLLLQSCGKLQWGWLLDCEWVIQMLNLRGHEGKLWTLPVKDTKMDLGRDTSLEDLHLGELEGRADLANTHSTHLVARLDGLLPRFAGKVSSQETTDESITSTVGIDDLVRAQLGNREDLGGVWGSRGDQHCRLGTLGEDNDTRLGGVDFRKGGDSLGDGGDVLDIRETVGTGVSFSLRLVTEDNVSVGDDAGKLSTVELGNEGSGEVQGEGLSGSGCFGTELKHALRSMSQEETTDIEQLSAIDQRSNSGGRQVRFLELLCRAKGGDQGAIVTSEDNSASTGLLSLLDKVDLVNTFPLVSGPELLSKIVVTDATGVDDGFWWETVCSSPGSVLSSTTGNVDNFVLLHDLVVDGKVLVLREDSIVRLEAVFFEEGLTVGDLDIQERVSDEECLVSHDEQSVSGGMR
jgi:hypothetical protein